MQRMLGTSSLSACAYLHTDTAHTWVQDSTTKQDEDTDNIPHAQLVETCLDTGTRKHRVRHTPQHFSFHT